MRRLLFESLHCRGYHQNLDHSPAGETGPVPAPKAQIRPESLRQKDLRVVGRQLFHAHAGGRRVDSGERSVKDGSTDGAASGTL